MPKCKKCEKDFPNKINGKSLHRRSYCLECSPYGSKKGYDLRKEANGRSDTKDCPICKRTFLWTKNDVCSSCRAAVQRWKKRKKAIDFLGGECKHCGVSDHEVLTFHHRNPKEKEFQLSYSWHNTSWDKILKEVKKCDLLCSNCHLKVHASTNQKRFKLIEDYYVRVVKRQTQQTQG